MRNIPNRVYLQIGLEKEGSVEDFNSLATDFVTWESEQIFPDDLQFISVDFILARIKEIEDELNNEESSFNRNFLNIQISTLKDILK